MNTANTTSNGPGNTGRTIHLSDLRQRVRSVFNSRAIPDWLKSKPVWLVWKATKITDPALGKFDKVPVYAGTGKNRKGTQGSPTDRAALTTFDKAHAAFLQQPNDYWGLGIAFLPDMNITAYDGDKCVRDGDVNFDTLVIIEDTYAEISPSRTGVRAIWEGSTHSVKNHPDGHELFGDSGFVTITGNRLGDITTINPLSAAKKATLEGLCNSGGKKAKGKQDDATGDPFDMLLTEQQVADARAVIAAMREKGLHRKPSAIWHEVIGCFARYGDIGERLANEFSIGCPSHTKQVVADKIKDKLRNGATGIGRLFEIAAVHGIDNPAVGRSRAQRETDGADEESYDEIDTLQPEEFTIDGLLPCGVTVIAGGQGIGKTSLIVPLACIVAGEIDGFEAGVMAELQRNVVYVSEDPEQVRRIRYALKKHRGLVESGRFHTRLARRRNAEEIGEFVSGIVTKYTITGPNDYQVKPLIVLDTTNACCEVENENDASQVGRFMSALKVGGRGCPVWIVAHLAKALLRADLEDLTTRGSGAWEGDAKCTAFIFADESEEDVRHLATRKRRFEATFKEARFETQTGAETVATPWGTEQALPYRYGVPEKGCAANRMAARAAARELVATAQLNADVELVCSFLVRQEDPVSQKCVVEGLVDEAGVSRDRARAACRMAIKRGRVSRDNEYRDAAGHVRHNGLKVVIASFDD